MLCSEKLSEVHKKNVWIGVLVVWKSRNEVIIPLDKVEVKMWRYGSEYGLKDEKIVLLLVAVYAWNLIIVLYYNTCL